MRGWQADGRSTSGQTLPSQDFCGTAALPLKPDIARRRWHGRKVPKAAVSNRSKQAPLLHHLVGANEQDSPDFEAERPGGSQIDHQVELGRLHDW
jgi:hypothetical protein